MARMVSYELKKILRRPFTLIVAIGCALIMAFIVFMQMNTSYALVWTPDLAPEWQKYVSDESMYFGENVGMIHSYKGIEYERQRGAFLEGEWTEERAEQIVREYLAVANDPANYTDELDEFSMQWRAMSFANQGMSEEDIAAYNEANPIRIMKPEFQYGEWQVWGSVSDLIDSYLTDSAGEPIPLREALPQIEGNAYYTYHNGLSSMIDMQAILGAILAAAIVLVGLSPLFSDEVVRGTEPVLLATRHGRGKLTAAKILAGLIFAVGSLLLVSAVNLLMSVACFGAEGLATTLQLDYFHANIGFSTTIGGFFLQTVLFQLAGAVGLAAVVMVLSALFGSALPVLFLGVVWVILVPMLAVYGIYPLNTIFSVLPPAPMFSVITFGLPITLLGLPAWVLSVLVCLAATLACCAFLWQRYRLKR